MDILNLDSSGYSSCTFITHVYVNDSIPLAIHETRTNDCREFDYTNFYEYEREFKLPEVYKTGTLDIYFGLQEYRERLKVHHEGKFSDAM